jgi:prevent-host-death family protein
MTKVGVYDAKTNLPKLLERVVRGEEFLITKHGKPVARLLPAGEKGTTNVEEIIRQMEEWQKREGPTLGPGLTIKRLRDEGRR